MMEVHIPVGVAGAALVTSVVGNLKFPVEALVDRQTQVGETLAKLDLLQHHNSGEVDVVQRSFRKLLV